MSPSSALSHNLNGQKLGRKGRDTRNRILVVARELIDESDETFTLSAVARSAGLGMPSLYNYFGDLSGLLMALLEPLAAEAEADHLAMLRERWPDDKLFDNSHAFVSAYYAFTQRHAGLLQLRNSLADAGDRRMMESRINISMPMISMIAGQMDSIANENVSPPTAMAATLYMGLERVVNVATDTHFAERTGRKFLPKAEDVINSEARLFELAIRDKRQPLS